MITRFDTEKFKTKFACEIKNFEPTDYFDRKAARKLDRYAQFALVAADEAVPDESEVGSGAEEDIDIASIVLQEVIKHLNLDDIIENLL